jgi:hypothetical protein
MMSDHNAAASTQQLAEIASAQRGDRTRLYGSSDMKTLTTWDGKHAMRIAHVGKPCSATMWGSTPSRTRHYVRAVDSQGRTWAGTAEPGMWAHMRLLKNK